MSRFATTLENSLDITSDDGSSLSSEVSPLTSREPSSSDLKTLEGAANEDTNLKKPRKYVTLEDRSKAPSSLYLSMGIILIAHFCGNIWSLHVASNWKDSIVDAGRIVIYVITYLKELTQDALNGKIENWMEFGKVCIFTGLVGSFLYVLIIAPLRAGFWTGAQSSKHKMHRYMGLAYLFQYFAAWAQYLANYEAAKDSYLPHFIALNGRFWITMCSASMICGFEMTGSIRYKNISIWCFVWFPHCFGL